MNIIKTFQVDGYLPAGLVLNARLAAADPNCVTPVLSPLDASGVASNLALMVKQADDSTMIRVKGKISGAVILGSLENDVVSTPRYIDFSSPLTPAVRSVDPLHDPCITLTPMRITGTMIIMSGTDAPIAVMRPDTNWGVTIQRNAGDQWISDIGAVSIPAFVYLGNGLTRSLYSVSQQSVTSSLLVQRGLEMAPASDEWKAMVPELEGEITSVVAMTEVPNHPKVPQLYRMTFEEEGETTYEFVQCVALNPGERVQADLRAHSLTSAALIANPARSVHPFKLNLGLRYVDVLSPLGLAGTFSGGGDWIGFTTANESLESTFNV